MAGLLPTRYGGLSSLAAPLKVVVIGTGFGRRTVAPAYESLGCQVELLSPRDAQRIKRAVANPCDLVSIHSPPFLHLEHVSLAVAHGRPVLCDKPFGRSAAEAGQMLELAAGAGVPHFLNFEFRFDPPRQQMKQLLDDGAIDRPLHMTCNMFMSSGRGSPHGWLFDRDLGGGWIGAFGSHHVDLLHWLFGKIESVSCLSRIDVPARPARGAADGRMQQATAEDAFTAWFKLINGVTSSLDSGCSSAVDLPSQIALLGTEGALQLTHGSELVLLRPDREPVRMPIEGNSNPVQVAQERWLDKVCRAVRTGEQVGPDFADGLACAEILDAMRAGR